MAVDATLVSPLEETEAASAWSSRWASLAAVAARAHAASLLELPLHGEDAMDAPPCSCLDPMWI